MVSARAVLLVVLSSVVLFGCQVVPPAILGGEAIVMDVANDSPRPIALVVAAPGEITKVVGSVDPAFVPPGGKVTARFIVPSAGPWAIFAGGGELMGSIDVGARRGALPMGIEIGPDGSQSWWCQADCP